MNDLTSKQAVIDALEKRTHLEWEYLKIIYPFLDVLEGLPTAQFKQKIGYWKRYNTYHGDYTSGSVDPDWRCSECGKQANINEWFMYDLTNFCPNCGARMMVYDDVFVDHDLGYEYKGCQNCKHQIEPLRACEWLEHGGDGRLHLTCPRWERRTDETN